MLTWAINEGATAAIKGLNLRDNPYDYSTQKNEAESWQWGWENYDSVY